MKPGVNKREKALRVFRPLLKRLEGLLPNIEGHLNTLAAAVDESGQLPAGARKFGAFTAYYNNRPGVKVYSRLKNGRCFRLAAFAGCTLAGPFFSFGMVEGGPEEEESYKTSATVVTCEFSGVSERGTSTQIIDAFIYRHSIDDALDFAESFEKMLFFLLGDVENAAKAVSEKPNLSTSS